MKPLIAPLPALAALAGLALAGCLVPLEPGEAAVARAEEQIVALLHAQQAAWNEGSVERFLEGYDRSEELTFVSGASVQRGFAATRERYLAHYDSREKMGTLAFSDLEVQVIARDAAVATGAWRLERVVDQPKGRFTLLLRKSNGVWRIVLDHTSSAEPAAAGA